MFTKTTIFLSLYTVFAFSTLFPINIMKTFFRAIAVTTAWILLFVTLALTNACRPISNPAQTELEEVLPNVITLTLTSPQGNTTAVWHGSTNATGSAVHIDTLVLAAGRTYVGKISAVNATKSPNVDLTAEYKKLADEHQFFYTVSGDARSRVSITVTDKDGNNLPVGLEFTLAASAGASVRGTLNVVLSHYDGVKKNGTSMSTESDIDITFPVVIR
jgi:hypothetical protein